MSDYIFENNQDFALTLDKNDELNQYRSNFLFPKEKNGYSCVYLCGNSLGLQAKNVSEYLEQELQDWSDFGVHGHTKAKRPWLTYHLQAREGFASLTGSKESEVINLGNTIFKSDTASIVGIALLKYLTSFLEVKTALF